MLEWLTQWRSEAAWMHCARVSHENQPILFAVVEHRAWVNSLARYLRDEQPEPPNMDQRQCRIGQWLHSTGVSGQSFAGPLDRIEGLHDAMHQHATQLLELKARGGHEAARAAMARIMAMRDEIIDVLEGMIT